jgi:hypothetical protein
MLRSSSTWFNVRSIVFLIFFFAIPCASWAQANQGSWSALSGLQPGQRIQVVGIIAKKHSGKFVSLSDTAVTYRGTIGQQSIAKQDVLSVKLLDHKHRLRNILIVAGVGAGVGAGIGAVLNTPCPSQGFCVGPSGAAIPAGFGAVLGGLGGAVVGMLLPSHSTIYQVSAH